VCRLDYSSIYRHQLQSFCMAIHTLAHYLSLRLIVFTQIELWSVSIIGHGAQLPLSMGSVRLPQRYEKAARSFSLVHEKAAQSYSTAF
jgi:hypothetical protein